MCIVELELTDYLRRGEKRNPSHMFNDRVKGLVHTTNFVGRQRVGSQRPLTADIEHTAEQDVSSIVNFPICLVDDTDIEAMNTRCVLSESPQLS